MLPWSRAIGMRRAVCCETQVNVLGEEGENGEEAAECTSALDFVEKLQAGVVIVVKKSFGRLGALLVCERGKDLNLAVDDDVEGRVAVEAEGVACEEAACLEMPGELVEDLAWRTMARKVEPSEHLTLTRTLTGFSRKPKMRMACRKSSR